MLLITLTSIATAILYWITDEPEKSSISPSTVSLLPKILAYIKKIKLDGSGQIFYRSLQCLTSRKFIYCANTMGQEQDQVKLRIDKYFLAVEIFTYDFSYQVWHLCGAYLLSNYLFAVEVNTVLFSFLLTLIKYTLLHLCYSNLPHYTFILQLKSKKRALNLQSIENTHIPYTVLSQI